LAGPVVKTVRAATAVERTATREGSTVLNASGYVTARRRATVSSKVTGKVVEVNVEEGMRVRKGQVLARLDTATLDREAASLRASLASARADRERLIAQQGVDRLDVQAAVASADDQRLRAVRSVEDAERDLAVAQDLFAAGAAARDEVRAAEGLRDAARRSLAQAELGLEAARSRLA
ncbi:MAG: biotin/lipoyl-binding protein, partial [Trueperaceae bacterium]|nr:biotin/lipoyl-binding protein [Trueperaceae bacterium]